jgi:hypothetical protein
MRRIHHVIDINDDKPFVVQYMSDVGSRCTGIVNERTTTAYLTNLSIQTMDSLLIVTIAENFMFAMVAPSQYVGVKMACCGMKRKLAVACRT